MTALGTRPRWLITLLVVAVLVAGGVALQALASRGTGGDQTANAPTAAPTDAAVSGAPGTTTAPSATPAQVAVAGQGTYQGLPVGFTKDGLPYRGDPDAPLVLNEYSDYLCPFCGRHFTDSLPTLLKDYGPTNQVLFVYHDLPLVSLHPTAPIGHAAALCVAEQGAALFWAMHDELFRTQDQWRNLPDPAAFVAGLAEGVGADMTAYGACIASGRTTSLVTDRVAAGTALGFNATPSFQFVDGKSDKTYTLAGAYPVDTFKQWIDALVAGEAPPQQDQETEAAKPVELPLWANTKGLRPDPDRPGFDMAGDPYKGNPEAKVAVVEFSNFQCPACRQHALDVQPAVDKALVDSGQVMWVYKNLPLRSLSESMAAATAAECAGDQGRFWQMHELLFKAQDQWAVDDPDADLVSLAGQVGVNGAQFSACLAGREGLERVVNDMFDAQDLVSTTPTFIVVSNGQGIVLTGSRPTDEFVRILTDLVDKANDPQPTSSP